MSLLLMERSTQLLASEMQAVNNAEGKSKEAASAHMLSCISHYCSENVCADRPFDKGMKS